MPSNPSKLGSLLTTFTVPPVEFCPKRVPWGPRKTSILSRSIKSVLNENFEAINIPSIWSATDGAAIAFWFVSSPTPLIDITVLYPSFLATVTPGAIALKPTKSTIFFVSNSSAPSAVTALETSCKLSVRFSAVTIISSITNEFSSLEEEVAADCDSKFVASSANKIWALNDRNKAKKILILKIS